MADNLQKVIYLSNSDYDTLVASGSVTVGGITITYSDNDIYLTPEIVATTSSDGLMSAADKTKLNGIAAGAQVNPSTYLVSATKANNTLTITNNSNSTTTVTYSDIGAASAGHDHDSTYLRLDGSNTMTGVLNLKASGNNETNIGDNGIRWGITSLPQLTFPQYFCVIDGFAQGGRQKWSNVANVQQSLGIVSRTAESGGTALSMVTTGEKYTWNEKADDNTVVHKGTSASAGIAENIYGYKTFYDPVSIMAGTSAAQLVLGASSPYSTYITFASGVSGNTGTLNLYKPSGFYDTYNVTLPKRTGILAEALQIGSTTIDANDSGVITLSPHYQHNIMVESSNNVVCSFQLINTHSVAYTIGTNLLTALNELGFGSSAAVCPATGMPYLSNSTTTAIITGVYCGSAVTSKLGCKYIPLIVTNNNTTTVNVIPTVSYTTVSIANSTIRDIVIPLF